MNSLKAILRVSIPAILLAAAVSAPAAQLSTDTRTAIPHDVQQLVVIDYHAMENSSSAMDLRERVMPPELKRFEDALHKSGLNENHDVEQLAFAPRMMANDWTPSASLRGSSLCRTLWPVFADRNSGPLWCAPTGFIRWPRPGW
jgi:hypothetical protein